nr:hypothetical protein [Tanacetum cinerariifolium]
EPPQNSDMHQLIEECSTEICEEQQIMEDTMLELVKIYQEKEFLCIHDYVDDLIESALNSKILLINSNFQRLEKEQQEVKNVVEQPAERENHKDKRECDLPIFENIPVCDNSDIFFDSKIDDDISVYDDDFEDIEYVEASLSDPEIFNQKEENVVQQEEEEIDIEGISQIQDVVLREKFLSINRLIANIESLNDNSTPDCDNPSIPRPPPEPPDAETDAGKEIPVVMNDIDKFDEDYHYFMFDKVFLLLSAESEDTIFDPGISD